MPPQPSDSLDTWLNYIESIHPTEIDLGLERLNSVANRLAILPESGQKPFVYTVAGTNGKGSTCTFLAALNRQIGQSVGLYRSPHLIHFNERVEVNGVPVSDSALTTAFAEVESARRKISLSYFEFTTLAALRIFQQQQLAVWVLEVGLGGRLDAVNIIDPDIAVITTIGLDHQDYLGDTLDLIGAEKAGIARSGKPLVLGSEVPGSVHEVASAKGAKVYAYNDLHGIAGDGLLRFSGSRVITVAPNAPQANVATALQAFSLCPAFVAKKLRDEELSTVLNEVSIPGRMQKLFWQEQCLVLDVGHNPQAAEYLALKLQDEGPVHLVIGMLADKDVVGFVRPLLANCLTLTLVSLPVPRGLTAGELQEKLGQVEVNVDVHMASSVREALQFVHGHAPEGKVFVGGSFYTVAEALEVLR